MNWRVFWLGVIVLPCAFFAFHQTRRPFTASRLGVAERPLTHGLHEPAALPSPLALIPGRPVAQLASLASPTTVPIAAVAQVTVTNVTRSEQRKPGLPVDLDSLIASLPVSALGMRFEVPITFPPAYADEPLEDITVVPLHTSSPMYCRARRAFVRKFNCSDAPLFEVHRILFTGYHKTTYLAKYKGEWLVIKSDRDEGLRAKRNQHSGERSRRQMIINELLLSLTYQHYNYINMPLGYCTAKEHTWTAWHFYAYGAYPSRWAETTQLKLKFLLSIARMAHCLSDIPPNNFVYLMDNSKKQYITDYDFTGLLIDLDGLQSVEHGRRLWDDRRCSRNTDCFFPQWIDRSPESNKCLRFTNQSSHCYGADGVSQVYNIALAFLGEPFADAVPCLARLKAAMRRPKLTERLRPAAVASGMEACCAEYNCERV